MTTLTGDILGHPQVGVHVSIIGDVLFHPVSLDDECKEMLSNTFDMEMTPFSIGGSSLLGSLLRGCLLYTSPSPRDRTRSRMPSSA